MVLGGGRGCFRVWRQAVRAAVKEGVVMAQTKLLFQVEYCTAERPSNSLRGMSQQYLKVVHDLRERCGSILWEYNVRVLGNSKFERWGSNKEMVVSGIKPRIGACEISLCWQNRLLPITVPLHSKLESRKWPNIDAICQELFSLLPTMFHDIRFMAQSASDTIVPNGVRVTVRRVSEFARSPTSPGSPADDERETLKRLGSLHPPIAPPPPPPPGPVVCTVFTGEDGVCSASLPCGSYSVRLEHALLETVELPYVVEDPAKGLFKPLQRVVMHPKLRQDQAAISLTWSAEPADLDLYVVTPTSKVCHFRLSDPLSRASLDCDVRNGFGPEIVTMCRPTPEDEARLKRMGVSSAVHVFVHQFSEDGDLAESEAEVRVCTAQGIHHVAKVPVQGVGQFWDVLSVDLTTMRVVERGIISAQEPSFDVMLDNRQLIKSDGKELVGANQSTKGGKNGELSPHLRSSSRILHQFQSTRNLKGVGGR